MRNKKFLKYFFIVIIACGLAISTIPWKILLEGKLKSQLAARGMAELQFHIASIGLHEIVFSDIDFQQVKLPSLSISYSPLDIIFGGLHEIKAGEVNIKTGNVDVALAGINASLVSQTWKIEKINISGSPVAIPPLSAKGMVKYSGGKFDLSGTVASDDKKTRLVFNFDSTILQIKEAAVPWSDGMLSTSDVSIPINSDKPVAINLGVKQVSLNSLLSAATSNRATATGVVSGTVPVIVNRDGTFIVKKGNLKAENAGSIKLAPDVIPSDQEQVALVREVLKDFHYSVFSMGIESADNKQLVMLLSLEGNNPDVYNGRVVKLNVHLSGDVIELITQSLNILGK